MRLVDGEQGQFAGFVEGVDHRQRAVDEQAFRGDVHEVDLAGEHLLLDGLRLAPVERRIEAGGLDAKLGQGIDLVLHERDERRDDNGAARSEQGGNLVAQTLAAAGRHEDECVAAVADVVDDFGLGAAEGGIAEDVAQDGEGGGASHGQPEILIKIEKLIRWLRG
jgi:hypothetical protein